MPIPESWLPVLEAETTKPYYQQLYQFIGAERHKYKVYPAGQDVFNALRYTPYERVRVVIIGQDPYHDENQAHGWLFGAAGCGCSALAAEYFQGIAGGCRIPHPE
jgi:uracil-DNA glycosylase